MLIIGALLTFAAFGSASDKVFSEHQMFPMNVKIEREGVRRAGGMLPTEVVLTFDDGPNSNTKKILEVLRAYEIKATFFVHIGQRSLTRQRRQILNAISNDGHSLANHGFKHSPLNGSTDINTVKTYLKDTHSVIEEYYRPNEIWVYRNPGGYWSRGRARALNRDPLLKKYVGPIFWNVGGETNRDRHGYYRAADWQCQSRGIPAESCAQGYYREIMSNKESGRGSLVLMHDIHAVTWKTLQALLQRMVDDNIQWKFILVEDIPAVQQLAD